MRSARLGATATSPHSAWNRICATRSEDCCTPALPIFSATSSPINWAWVARDDLDTTGSVEKYGRALSRSGSRPLSGQGTDMGRAMAEGLWARFDSAAAGRRARRPRGVLSEQKPGIGDRHL